MHKYFKFFFAIESNRRVLYSGASNDQHSGNRNKSKISLRRVEEVLNNNEPSGLLLNLVDPKFGFEEYMSADRMSDELIRLFLKLINKVLDCNVLELQKSKIIVALVNSNYFNELVYNNIDKSKNSPCDIEFIEDVLKICNYILKSNPARLPDLKKLLDRLEIIIKLHFKNNNLIEEFEEKIGNVRLDIENQERQRQINKTKKSKVFSFDRLDCETSEPPDLFKEISIIPSLSEITSNERIFLRKNIITGAYKNAEHYLDVNFRLLREDFLQPLRDGINKFKMIIEEERTKTPNLKMIQSQNLMKRISSIDGLRAYYDVYFSSCSCTDKGITLSIQLDTKKFKGIKLEASRRLIYGSLVCLSNDFFNENFILGIICDSDPKNLKKGIIRVILEKGINEIDEELLIHEKTKYLMFETTSYYEAYVHVLNALKSFKDDNFPFLSQIVECNNLKRPPLYLMKAYEIDLRTLVSDDDDHFDYGTGTYVFNSSNYAYAEECNIYDEKSWPSPRQMKLDDSQYKAIRSALTQKICIIQGPPGTGKTFISVKIVKLLLNNSHLWASKNGRHVPILMVCFTNHALDQFLEACVEKCKLSTGVVRIGSRCENKNLEIFLLKNIKSNMRKNHSVEKYLHYETKRQRDRMKRLENQMKSYLNNLNYCKKNILDLNKLERFMPPEYYKQLTPNDKFLEWLGFEKKKKKNNDSSENEAFIVNNSHLINEIEIDYNSDVDENNERMLDEDFDILQNTRILIEDEIENKLEKEYNVINENSFEEVDKRDINTTKELIRHITENTAEKEIYIKNVWNLSKDDRICLYTRWVNLFRNYQYEQIKNLRPEFNESVNLLKELRLQEDKNIMQNSYIGN